MLFENLMVLFVLGIHSNVYNHKSVFQSFSLGLDHQFDRFRFISICFCFLGIFLNYLNIFCVCVCLYSVIHARKNAYYIYFYLYKKILFLVCSCVLFHCNDRVILHSVCLPEVDIWVVSSWLFIGALIIIALCIKSFFYACYCVLGMGKLSCQSRE